MCEIAITKPQEHRDRMIMSEAMTMYRAQRSSLGLLAAYDVGDEYEYEIYRAVEPDPDELMEWIGENNDAERMFIHARMATHGDVIEEHVHPLEIECDICSVDYLMHNGIVRGYRNLRQQYEARGHDFSTNVDSEVIAHAHETVPTTWDDAENQLFGRQPSWVLFNNDRIYVHNGGVYHLTKEGVMCKGGGKYRTGSPRDIGPNVEETEGEYTDVIIRPSA